MGRSVQMRDQAWGRREAAKTPGPGRGRFPIDSPGWTGEEGPGSCLQVEDRGLVRGSHRAQ